MAKNKKTPQTKLKPRAIPATVLAVIVLLALLPVNLLAQRVDIRWDMTPNRFYTISELTPQLMATLDNTVDIYTMYSLSDLEDLTDISADIRPIYEAMGQVISQYDQFEKVNVINADPYTDEGAAVITALSLDQNLNLQYGDTVIKCGGVIKVISLYDMLVTETDENTGITSHIGYSCENDLTSAILFAYLHSTPETRLNVYTVEGHGEKTDYEKITDHLSAEGYAFSSLKLSDGIPENASMLILAAPEEDLTASERVTVDEYLDRGGAVCMLMPPNEAKLDYVNIEEILRKFSIGMRYDTAHDPVQTNSATPDNTSLFRARYTPGTIIQQSLLDSEEVFPIASDSRTFYVLSTGKLANQNVEIGSITYGTAKSTPTGGTNPAPEAAEGELNLSMYAEDPARGGARLFVIGEAEFIDDTNISNEFSMGNYYLFMDAVTWLTQSDVNLEIADKVKENDFMALSAESTATGLIVLFAAIPAVIAGAGIVVWLRRRKS
ncbi:MAG: Gldg family protein [Oscillospiraceae bacterium]|jgi:hypothetical protein|nr:Gldg family protein [Oscillospiraceae bacterium]